MTSGLRSTRRDAWAASFHEVLSLSSPRTDCPMHLPDPPPPTAEDGAGTIIFGLAMNDVVGLALILGGFVVVAVVLMCVATICWRRVFPRKAPKGKVKQSKISV